MGRGGDEDGRTGFHISWGSFSMGMVAGIKGGEWTSSAVSAVAGTEVCQLSLTEKVTKDEGREDILKMGMDERRCWRRRSR